MARLGLKSPVCRMVRRRPVRCLDENNQVVPDDDCLKGWKQLSGKSAGKPPVFQRCWAACGITNRTCEDLQWEPSSVKKRGVSGDTRTCGSLQEGGKYPNGCWADYGSIKLPDGRSFRGEQAISLVKAEEACGMSEPGSAQSKNSTRALSVAKSRTTGRGATSGAEGIIIGLRHPARTEQACTLLVQSMVPLRKVCVSPRMQRTYLPAARLMEACRRQSKRRLLKFVRS